MSLASATFFVEQAALAFRHAAQHAGWPYSQNLKHHERLCLELADALRTDADLAPARRDARPVGATNGTAATGQTNGVGPAPGRRGPGAGRGLLEVGHDTVDGGEAAGRARAARAWSARAGTVRDLIARLSEMPDFEVRVNVHGVVGCPGCERSVDGYDLNLDHCSVRSSDDIDHIVHGDREWVQITVAP